MHRQATEKEKAMRRKNRRRNRRGFTLVEIMVVVIIVAFLATLIMPTVFRHVTTTKRNVAKSKIAVIEETIEIFMISYGRLPENLEELVTRPADIPEEKWGGSSLRAKDIVDPWGRQFVYKQPGDHWQYDLYSLGKDGQEGGENEDADIVNW